MAGYLSPLFKAIQQFWRGGDKVDSVYTNFGGRLGEKGGKERTLFIPKARVIFRLFRKAGYKHLPIGPKTREYFSTI